MKKKITIFVVAILLLGGTIAFTHHTPQDTMCKCGCGYTIEKCPC